MLNSQLTFSIYTIAFWWFLLILETIENKRYYDHSNTIEYLFFRGRWTYKGRPLLLK